MNFKAIKQIENEIFSLDTNERLFLFKRISVRMSPYLPQQGPAVTFFSSSPDVNTDMDPEKDITAALEDWEGTSTLPLSQLDQG